ncbi:MAG: hypothetical protein WCS94_22805 [Verrucomicrobiota bacterium]
MFGFKPETLRWRSKNRVKITPLTTGNQAPFPANALPFANFQKKRALVNRSTKARVIQLTIDS